jgi:beta-lactamase class A
VLSAFLIPISLALPLAADTVPAALLARVSQQAAASGAETGVAWELLESGERGSLRGGEAFPMQSVFKLPVAVSVLRRVDAGTLRLDQPVTLRAADLRPGFSPIAEAYAGGARRFTLGELLRRMAGESDNTAADWLLARVGGPAAVTADLARMGVSGVRVDRGEGLLSLDFYGIPRGPGRESRAAFAPLFDELAEVQKQAGMEAYLRDPRDTATPEGLVRLLARIWSGRALSPESRGRLLTILRASPTGPGRLRAGLPPGVPLAHKTGTSGTVGGTTAVVNDAGIIDLPDGRHLVVVVLMRRASRGTEPAEAAMAAITRTLYQHYTTPPRP